MMQLRATANYYPHIGVRMVAVAILDGISRVEYGRAGAVTVAQLFD